MHDRVIRKVFQRGTKIWVSSFFKSPFSLLSYIGAYFESWVKFLGSSFFHLANFEKIVESKIGFTHIRTYCLQFRIGVDKFTLTNLF